MSEKKLGDGEPSPEPNDVFPNERESRLAQEIHMHSCEMKDDACTDEIEWIAQHLAENRAEGDTRELKAALEHATCCANPDCTACLEYHNKFIKGM